MMRVLDENGLVPGRIARSADGQAPPAPSWQEREQIEQAVSRMRGEAGNGRAARPVTAG